jgi:hypothetical protein
MKAEQPQQPKKVQCYKAGCNHAPVFDVVLIVKCSATDPGTVTAPIMQACFMHHNVSFNDVATPGAWLIVEKYFVANGKLIPSREHSSIELKPIEDATKSN